MANELVPQEPEDFETEHPMPFPLAEEAVRLFLESGSLAEVGRALHVPVQDLYRTAKTPWWIQEVGLRSRMERAALDARLTKLLGKTLDNIEDVLENGEDHFDKEGGKHVKKVPGMALARIADVLFDKRQVVRGQPSPADTANRKLTELADKLEKFGRSMQAKPILEAEDVTPKGASDAASSQG